MFQSGTLNPLWSQLNPCINADKSYPTLFSKIFKIFIKYVIEKTFLFSVQVNELWETKGCNNTIYASSNYVLLTVRLWNFKDARFLPKNQHAQRIFFKQSYYECSSKNAKIVLSKSIFSVKNQLNFFKKKFHLRISI